MFRADIFDVRAFAAILRSVNIGNRATVTMTLSGLTVTVEEARTLLGTAFVFADMFTLYHYAPLSTVAETSTASQQDVPSGVENTTFEIPLDTLVECLNLFGNAGGAPSARARRRRANDRNDDDEDGDEEEGEEERTGPMDMYVRTGQKEGAKARLMYDGLGSPLVLQLAEEGGPHATCEIVTFDPEPQLELPFDNESTVLRIILKSSWLRDALSEMDGSCDKLTFIGNPPPSPGEGTGQGRRASARVSATAKPMLRIRSAGTFGSSEMDYPNDREVLESFECSQAVSFSYRFSHISRTLRALGASTKTSMRVADDGLLSLQFLMPSARPRGGTSNAFVEFRFLALDDVDSW